MNWIHQRYSPQNNSTLGMLFEKTDANPLFFCHLVEDDDKGEKGDKRMPAGFYELKIRKEDTPLTIKHRATYGPWFVYHVEITGIPGHSGVYPHAGNTEVHTHGCPLLNDTVNNNSIDIDIPDGSRSTQAFKRWYLKVYPHLVAGGKAFWEIRDEKTLR